MSIEEWNVILAGSFSSLWTGVIAFLPRLILSLVVFLVGWLIAGILGRLASQIVGFLKIDKILQRTGIEEPLKRANLQLNTGNFIGGLVRWFFLLVFLVAAIDILGLSQLNAFLRDTVLLYLPQVVVAAFILIAAVVLADAVQKIVSGSARAAKLSSAAFLGGVAKWAIWVFAILAALYQLGIVGPLIQTLFTAFVGMLAIAGGLAFGLGGKEAATQFIEKLRKDISPESE